VISPARRQTAAPDYERVQIAIVLFDRFAARDVVTFSEAFAALPGAEIALVSTTPGSIRDNTHRIELTADAGLHEAPLPDVLVVPGGEGASVAHSTSAIEAWIRAAVLQGACSVSVATGSLIVARAGVLKGRAVAAPALLHAILAHHGAHPVSDRAVIADRVATAHDITDVTSLLGLLEPHFEH
jgi:transcriptional regulator GlxA family with amidase domain